MEPRLSHSPPRIALLVAPVLLVDLLTRQLAATGAQVLVDDTTTPVDLVVVSSGRADERPDDGTPVVTVARRRPPAATVAGDNGTLVADLDTLLQMASALGSRP